MHTPIPSTLLPLLLLFLFLSHLPSVSATPPACLLAAINAQDHPSDLKSLCGTLENAVKGNITQMCKEGSYKEAVSAYQATCLEGAGVTIAITSSSSTSTATSTSLTKSGTASTSSSGTAVASGTGATGPGSASASATTPSGSTTAGATGSTASASGVTAQGGVGALVVPGLLGLFGLAGAVLL